MAERFTRDRVRHEPQIRKLTVARITDVAPAIRRFTFIGPTLTGFTAPGPADHVKVFLPDPATGHLSVPNPGEFRAPVPEGEVRVVRDYTPFAYRPASADQAQDELDIDFYLHRSSGVAAQWAHTAHVGDPIGIAGPRGSALLPSGVRRIVLIADESALPSVHRWLQQLPDVAEPIVIAFTQNAATATEYLVGAAEAIQLFHVAAADAQQTAQQIIDRLSEVQVGIEDFVYAAGEATTLIPIRRYLRRDLGLSAQQVVAQGYWKRGVVALDHHAPLDPESPED